MWVRVEEWCRGEYVRGGGWEVVEWEVVEG